MATEKILSSKPHFLQPVLPGFKHQQFSIPVSFFKYLKGQKCERAILRGRTGKIWPVKINSRSFEDGWKDFVEDHDLHVGDFLVFRHEGEMVFDVMVFESSACLREYPSFPAKEFDIKEEEIEFQEEQLAQKSSPEKYNKKEQNRTTLQGKAATSVHEQHYFVVKLTSYSAKRCKLHIPIKFARTHGLCNSNCKMILMNEKGRSWPAVSWNKKSDGQVYIGRGWTSFRDANNLKAGDSFIFKHIEKQKIPTFKFHRFYEGLLQANTEAKMEPTYQEVHAGSLSIRHHHISVSKKKTAEEVEKECRPRKPKKKQQCATNYEVKASSSVLEQPYFVAKVTSYGACRSILYIPTTFARLNNLNNRRCKMILVDAKGRSWPAKLWHKTSDGRAYIHDWNAFRVANDLHPGDSFILELVDKGEMPVFKMSMMKVNTKTDSEMIHQDGEASSSSIRHPYFYVTVKAYHIQNSYLQIPSDFARRNDLIGKCSEMILTNERGNSWVVSLETGKDGKVYIGCGWSEFAKANGLRERNIFMLELVEGGNKPAMKFYGVEQRTAGNKISYKDSAQRISFENCEDVKPIIQHPE
ncbi:putative B3 domain-containing protein REM15 isoform X3 [Manihot esculenta]|uniref:TF-B3 domain-containing protein n=1 Tax=Manihot esculenta TaxID=3983 RepID=A0A2C9W3G2_MANES|nr:putative B3 domain-containing protein REM15 isoform X3 [Manihot esculenta]OAY53553.1 hypothetical protein MANES_03G005400v8 [Manihot esculenta]